MLKVRQNEIAVALRKLSGGTAHFRSCACSRAIIDVEAGKFLGVRRIFAQISPNLPEKKLQRK